MGSVTATVSNTIGEMYSSESLHFESYEDFLNYESIKSPVDFDSSQEENKNNIYNNIYLTEDEVYTLRVLLGHTAGDKDCNSIAEKLEILDPTELNCVDYDKIYFTFVVDGEKMVLKDGEKDVTIRFKQVEEE